MTNLAIPGGGPTTADRFYLPEEFYRRHGLTDLLPKSAERHALMLRSKADIGDLAQMTDGRAAKPTKPVVLYGPDGATAIGIVSAGVTEAAELEDVAYHVWEKHQAKLNRGEPVIDTARLRAELGYAPREEFLPLMREAFAERIRRHRRHPVTDPAPVHVGQARGVASHATT